MAVYDGMQSFGWGSIVLCISLIIQRFVCHFPAISDRTQFNMLVTCCAHNGIIKMRDEERTSHLDPNQNQANPAGNVITLQLSVAIKNATTQNLIQAQQPAIVKFHYAWGQARLESGSGSGSGQASVKSHRTEGIERIGILWKSAEAEIASFSSIVHICLLLSNYAGTHTHRTHMHTHTYQLITFMIPIKPTKFSHMPRLSLSLVMTDANIWFNFDRRSQALYSPAYFLLGNSCQQLPIALRIYYILHMLFKSQGPQSSVFSVFSHA